MSAGGQYIRGGATYQYKSGPDRRQYAVGGEVSIDSSPVPNSPEATIQKMEVVQRAAMAPADPSSQDYSVAAAAQTAELQARQEMMKNTLQGIQSGSTTGRQASKGQSVNIVV